MQPPGQAQPSCHHSRGTSVLPSLILRLEQLPIPSATAAQSGPHEDPPATIDVDAPRVVDVAVDEDVAELTDTRTAPHGIGTARQVLKMPAPQSRPPTPEVASGGSDLSRWSVAIASAFDGCFLVDTEGILLSISVAAVALLGVGDAAVVGRHLLELLRLVDFETGAEAPDYATRIPALVVLDGPGLARSMMRLRHDSGAVVTLDSSAAPIHDSGGQLLGSVTFLAPIPAR
jgi:PAS domain-containing protein